MDEVKGEEKNAAKVNYFIGSDPSRWKTGISTYGRLNLGEVYPGIEVKLRASGKNIEKFFYIKPGADPKRIRLRLAGSESLKIAGDGTLEVLAGSGGLKFSRPVAYQEVNGNRIEVNVAYSLQSSEPRTPNSELIYCFKVGDYDKTRELVIDPLLQSTYLGSTG